MVERHDVAAIYGVASNECKVVLLTHALVFVVRHMGNGVDRVEMPRLAPIEEVKQERDLPGRSALTLLPGGRMVDLARAAAGSLGLISACHNYVADGFVRSVDDERVEVAAWLLSSV